MRRTRSITIEGARSEVPGHRDDGKTFIVTEMPADQAERWALRAILALGNAGIEVPENLEEAGFAGLAMLGYQALNRLRFEDAESLLDEMMLCVQYQHAPNQPLQKIYAGEESQIEEVKTRLILRKAVFELHTDFLLAGAKSTSA